MDRREFQLIEGSSKKFWAIQLNGTSFTVHYGRIGTSGQSQEKSFPTEDAAKREYEKLIQEKTKKGYSEVGAEASGASGPAPAPVAKKKAPIAEAVTAQAPKKSEEPSAPDGSASSAPAKPVTLTRSIKLPAKFLRTASPQASQPIAKPETREFDYEDALERLRRIGNSPVRWGWNWNEAKIPDFPSAKEAQFWLLAFQRICEGTLSPQDVAKQMEEARMEGKMSVAEVQEILKPAPFGDIPFLNCAAALLPPEEFATLEGGPRIAEAFSRYVRPYLSLQQREELRQTLAPRIIPMIPASDYESWPSHYWIGAILGCEEQIASIFSALPDGFYKGNSPGYSDYYQRPQWLLFSLKDRDFVQTQFRRLGLKLRDSDQARAWIGITEYSGLDVIAASACHVGGKDDAAALARTLLQVTAPEAALPALQIHLDSKAPLIGKEWLAANPLEAAVGLTPVAMGQGKVAEAAHEHLRTMRYTGHTEILRTALQYLPPDQQEWLNQEVVNYEEEVIPDLPHEEMPEDLRTALEGKAPSPTGSAWISMAPLPPIKVQSKKLSAADVEKLLRTLKATPLGTESTLLSALKTHADRNSLDTFAWKLFHFWLSNGAPSKDKWALATIGHLGGDASVLKLTPLIREWPGESQHQRAVFGLECLRTVGSDTAMMALNGIAQKLKFKGLKEKAQAMMEEIAKARGLTREQLADRIVPDCGLDERGSRVFDFGPRHFRFVLGPEMKPLVRDGAGKVRPDLPSPNNSDDKEKAEVAVAEWKLLKKTLREVLKIQADRLEDAMITGRRWTPEEFDSLLVKHPLMVNLVRQLVFGVYDGSGKLTQTFRVTEDQTLADQEDDDLEAPAAGQIGVVHPAHLDEAAKGAWGQVLSDYEIIPPFQQLGRTICRPETEDLEKTEITRYRGPKVPGITMYGMLERSHWLRDTPADGGGFMQHSRYFPSANLTAFIQYSGMSIGYYEEPQELEQVYFVPGHVRPDWWGEHKNRLKIKDVDQVVLSEVLRLANAIISKAE